ncbi:MAG: leucine-rich repeat protein [Firmicutes bacterium]|nr:leucine-rich repeat protein [Bacillota bacterium]
MDKRLIDAFDRMTMPDDCAQRIQRKLRRALRQQKSGVYTEEARPGDRRQGWGIAAALVALVLVLSAGGAFFFLKAGEPVATATVPEQTVTTTVPDTVWQEYSDDGIRFSYPLGWGITGDGSVTTFCDSYPSQRTVMLLERTEAWEADLSSDTQSQQNLLRERWPDAVVSEVVSTKVGGSDAVKVTYTYTDNGVIHPVVQYTTAVQFPTAVSGVGYRLYFYPPAENPESFDAVQEAILNSLEFGQNSFPEDYTHNRNSDGGITIVTYLGNDENICIPDKLDGRQVTVISEAPGYYAGDPGAFAGCDTLRTVTIPEGVTAIGDNSFSGCVNLQSVYVPASVQTVGSSAFSDCPSLKRVIFAGDAPAHGNFVFDSSLNVTVLYQSGTSGWEDTWAGRPVRLVGSETPEPNPFVLSDQGKAFLEKMCYSMPDWGGYASLNESFWREFLFRSFTSPELTDNGMAMTVCGEQELTDTPWGQAVKVSRGGTVEPYVRLAMGCELPDFAPSQEDMEPGQTPFYYDREDGCYYIGLSDFGDIGYTFLSWEPYYETNSTYSFATFAVYSGEPENVIQTVVFGIYPAENENGFTIIDKTTSPVEDSDEQKIETVARLFSQAYFAGDEAQMQRYLAADYNGSLDIYLASSPQSVVIQSVDVLNTSEDSGIVKVTFLETEQDDSFTYLMLDLVRQGDHWRISSYGLDK